MFSGGSKGNIGKKRAKEKHSQESTVRALKVMKEEIHLSEFFFLVFSLLGLCRINILLIITMQRLLGTNTQSHNYGKDESPKRISTTVRITNSKFLQT